ncbi:beta-ketoacyl synthase chain length factor [soil metagenome]
MPLLYIHDTSCISPQQNPLAAAAELKMAVDNKLEVTEPTYDGIPPGILRRMGKAIRIGVGAAMPMLKQTKVDGIIIGTANGGMEDCIKFLNQIIDYDEGRLTPGNFVASTTNAIAAQLGLLTSNKGYNITHVQSGLSFENAILDAVMMLEANTEASFLVGGLDEISAYNYNIDLLGGWYKKTSPPSFYDEDSIGAIAGEGSAMFVVNGTPENAKAHLEAIHFFHTTDEAEVAKQMAAFFSKHLTRKTPSVLITGENGDNRFIRYDKAVESVFTDETTVARYKHLCGEYATASAFALWLACEIMTAKKMPAHMVKKQGRSIDFDKILIYNHYKESQHSFMLVTC